MENLRIASDNQGLEPDQRMEKRGNQIKDGAYYCYCAYVLRISRYSDFQWVVLINTGIFLRASKLCGKSRTQQVLLVSKKKIGGNHTFSRDN